MGLLQSLLHWIPHMSTHLLMPAPVRYSIRCSTHTALQDVIQSQSPALITGDLQIAVHRVIRHLLCAELSKMTCL